MREAPREVRSVSVAPRSPCQVLVGARGLNLRPLVSQTARWGYLVKIDREAVSQVAHAEPVVTSHRQVDLLSEIVPDTARAV
jgi:hypothetical protein